MREAEMRRAAISCRWCLGGRFAIWSGGKLTSDFSLAVSAISESTMTTSWPCSLSMKSLTTCAAVVKCKVADA